VCSGTDNLQRGAERFCLSITLSLSKSGHDISLVTGTQIHLGHGHKKIPIVMVPEVVNPWLRKSFFDYFNPCAISIFREHLNEFRPDIVHFHSLYGLSTALVRIVSQYCPTVVTLHDASLAFSDSGIVTPKNGLANTYLKVPHGFFHRLINRHHLRDANLVSPSRWLAQFFHSAGYNNPLHIPNGIVSNNRTTQYDNIVLWVGAITVFKGLPHIIDSVAPLVAERGWRFIVVGDGPQRKKLSQQYPQVEFIGHQDPTPYYQLSSILLVTSLGMENFPTVILEAMRHGVCVVGHDVGGIPELVSHNQTGMLYKSKDILMKNLTDLITDEEQVRRLGSSARKEFVNNYLLDKCTKQYISLYRSLIKEHDRC